MERTKVGHNLPIYTEYRNGGNSCYTLIKRISGDSQSLSHDLAQHFVNEIEPSQVSKNKRKTLDLEKIQSKWRIREKLGHVWVHGKHTEIIRKFLESKGF